jgi:hypothetical protein
LILVGGNSNNFLGSQPNGAVVVVAESRSGDAVLKDLIIRKELSILRSSHDSKYLGPIVALVDLDRLVCEFHRPTGNDAQSKNNDNQPGTQIHQASSLHLVSAAANAVAAQRAAPAVRWSRGVGRRFATV